MRFWKGWCVAKGGSAFEKVVGMERVDATEESLRLDGRKVCNIKRADISQAGRNKATVCALPSIHLPLTREASVVVRGEG